MVLLARSVPAERLNPVSFYTHKCMVDPLAAGLSQWSQPWCPLKFHSHACTRIHSTGGASQVPRVAYLWVCCMVNGMHAKARERLHMPS